MTDVWNEFDNFDLLSRIKSLGKHQSVADWGCGKNDSPISCHVKKLWCDLLYSVDAWPENIVLVSEASERGEYAALKHIIERCEIQPKLQEFILEGTHFDLSLCLDIVEHMEKEEATQWLRDLERVSDRILIWIPLGPAIMDHDWWGSNHYFNAHRSQWEEKDLTDLGYACQVLKDFHEPIFGRKGIDGCWAYKTVKREVDID